MIRITVPNTALNGNADFLYVAKMMLPVVFLFLQMKALRKEGGMFRTLKKVSYLSSQLYRSG